jgi:predicted  nucleic acid-binding Zn-ribbon protein
MEARLVALENEMKETNKRISHLEKEMRDVKTWLEQVENQLGEVKESVQRLEVQLADDVHALLQSIHRKIDEKGFEIYALNKRLLRVEATIEQLQSQV